MNLAFLSLEYPHPRVGSSGGIGTSIRNLARAYVKDGHNAYVFVMQRNFERFDDDGIHVIPVTNKVTLRGLIGVYLKSREIARQVNHYICEYGIKILEVPDWCGTPAFMSFDCEVVVKFHGSDAYFCRLDGRKQKLKNYFYEFVNIQRAKWYISVSKYAADLSRVIFHTGKKNFSIIPNGINLEDFKLGPKRQTNGPPQILYLGSLVRKKGCLEIPGIFNELQKLIPETRLLLIGNDVSDIFSGGKSTWELMSSLFDNPDAVTWGGPRPYQEIREILTNVDVCIFPSFAEALPMSWLEAMAMQKPIVASNIGWANEIAVDGKEAFLANPGDHATYARKIAALLQDPTLRENMGKQARLRIEHHFDIQLVAREHIKLYGEICK